MIKPTEHKTVQARILEYSGAIGWTFVSHQEAEQRRGFDAETLIKDRAKGRTLLIKTAEMLFRAPEADKPTVLLMIDRNELEDQMLKNLAV